MLEYVLTNERLFRAVMLEFIPILIYTSDSPERQAQDLRKKIKEMPLGALRNFVNSYIKQEAAKKSWKGRVERWGHVGVWLAASDDTMKLQCTSKWPNLEVIPLFGAYVKRAVQGLIQSSQTTEEELKHTLEWVRELQKLTKSKETLQIAGETLEKAISQREFMQKSSDAMMNAQRESTSKSADMVLNAMLGIKEPNNGKEAEIHQQPTEGQPMKTKFNSKTFASSLIKSVKVSGTVQGGSAGLAAIKQATLRLLPIKWGFWARITGKNRKIAEHPLTTLAVTVGLNALAHASTEENSKVRVVTQSLQDAALLEAVNSVGELKNVVNSFLEPESAAESER